ncbi:flagellar biosynthesis regulator FlaF [Paracoccus ravus]|uniref:flagellar biosynthesis regulator FlaF n=1 Tax=Paracoccus ravus TaxID=2447760 RepID=UPI00106E4675|nr:flagellar biosynthesis regulator FlaF [Paracoccus ravus]
MSLSAYRQTIKHTETPRAIERRILAEINAELTAHRDGFDRANSNAEKLAILSGSLRSALTRNLKFWTALRLDLISPGNQLPENLRANLINLSLFVERQVASVLAGKGSVGTLVDINASIIAGLAGLQQQAA